MYCPDTGKTAGGACTATGHCKNCHDNSKVYIGDSADPGHGGSGCGTRCYCDRGFYEMNVSGQILCSACPEGGACGSAKLNFTSIPSKPGYWQIKAWFAHDGKNLNGKQFHYSQCTEKLNCRNAVKMFDMYFRDFSTDACNAHEATAATGNTACSGVLADINGYCVCQGSAKYSFLHGDGCRFVELMVELQILCSFCRLARFT
jgi:hypothetical protein